MGRDRHRPERVLDYNLTAAPLCVTGAPIIRRVQSLSILPSFLLPGLQ